MPNAVNTNFILKIFPSIEEMKLENEPEKIDYAFSERQFFQYINNNWELIDTKTVPHLTQFQDINLSKINFLNKEPLSYQELLSKKGVLHNFINKDFNEHEYFLLYFQEINYFLVFKKNNEYSMDLENLIVYTMEQDIGKILYISDNKDKNNNQLSAIEIWAQDTKKNNGIPVQGYLFPFTYNVKYGKYQTY